MAQTIEQLIEFIATTETPKSVTNPIVAEALSLLLGKTYRLFDGDKVNNIVQEGGFSDVFVVNGQTVDPRPGDLLYNAEGTYGRWGVITDVHLEGQQLYVTYVWEGCVNTIMIDENGDAARYVNRYKTPKVYDAQSVLSASSAGNMQDYFLIKDSDNPTQSYFEFWQVGDLIGSPKGGIIVGDVVNPGGLDNTMMYIYGGEIVTITYKAQSPAKILSVSKAKIGSPEDAANATGSLYARVAFNKDAIGNTTDAAKEDGSIYAQLKYIKEKGQNYVDTPNGIIVYDTEDNIEMEQKEVDYINSLSSISILFIIRTTINRFDWYRYIKPLGDVNRDGVPALAFGYDGGFLIFDKRVNKNPDFDQVLKGYKQLVSINRVDGRAVCYNDEGKQFDEVKERFKQSKFFSPVEGNKGIMINTGDAFGELFKYIIFNFDIERICQFTNRIVDYMRNAEINTPLITQLSHSDLSVVNADKYKPNTYRKLTLEQDNEGYWHNKGGDKAGVEISLNTADTTKRFNRKAYRISAEIEVIEGSVTLDNVMMFSTSEDAALYSIRNKSTGETKQLREELSVGTWEIVTDAFNGNSYRGLLKTVKFPVDIKYVRETIEPYAAIIDLDTSKLYDGISLYDKAANKIRKFLSVEDRNPVTNILVGDTPLNAANYGDKAPTRSPRFVGEKYYNVSDGSVYEAGNLTAFKKITQ